MKRCSRCGETKDLGEFHRDKSKRDGRRCICRACVNACYSRVRKQPVIHWVRDHTGVWRAVEVYDPEPDVYEVRNVPDAARHQSTVGRETP